MEMWMGVLRELAKKDPKYREIRVRYDTLEDAFGKLAAKLTDEEQDIAWAFVCTSDELDRRLLELVCERFGIDPVGYLEQMGGME